MIVTAGAAAPYIAGAAGVIGGAIEAGVGAVVSAAAAVAPYAAVVGIASAGAYLATSSSSGAISGVGPSSLQSPGASLVNPTYDPSAPFNISQGGPNALSGHLLPLATSEPWWQELKEGRYFGTGFGESAVEYWAQRHVDTGSWLYGIPGTFAATWTPDTYLATAGTFASGFSAARYLGRPFYRYVGPKSNANSPWLTRGRGWKPPYGKNMEQAKDALQMKYKPDDLIRARVKWNEPIVGPRRALKHPEWGQGGGPEYYRGWRFPED